ncbi:MAG: metallophosphoesterase [Terriglobia bacterium]
MKIGVVSDTHGYFDPRLPEVLAGVDAIVHAGDVGSEEVLDQLSRIAKVRAVCGNIDPAKLKLPTSLRLRFGGVPLRVEHQLPFPQSELEAWSDGSSLGKSQPERRDAFLKTFGKSTKVVIFGHSHKPCLLAMGHKLFFNPGSAGQQRFSLPRCFGLLEIFARGIRGTLLSLEGDNEKLPGKIWLPVGG